MAKVDCLLDQRNMKILPGYLPPLFIRHTHTTTTVKMATAIAHTTAINHAAPVKLATEKEKFLYVERK